ncbi:MAG TPA: amidohydrolase family protein [Planktothrix sp.]|jgi:N-acetylglucosamine-6-phosphate deacetylase
MGNLLLVGGEVITPLEERFTDLLIENDVVAAINGGGDEKPEKAETLDVSGCYVTPGLIDLQVNGNEPCNFWGDPEPAQVEALCRRMLQSGVTAFLPTLITDDLQHMNKNISFLQSLGVGKEGALTFGVRMPGLHLEGPCISPKRPGVHPPQHLKPLNIEVLKQIVTPIVLLVTVAPELDGKGEALAWLKEKGVTVSLGHSNATCDEANAAFERGIRMMTHTFNALPPLHHRDPGAVAAALLDDRVSCCIICDGLHLDPTAVRLILKSKTAQRTILVTDIAQVGTSHGGLVGSSLYLDEAVRNVVQWQAATFPEAIRMSTWNAACAVGLAEKFGKIAVGRQADLVVWDKASLAIKHVIVAGKRIS